MSDDKISSESPGRHVRSLGASERIYWIQDLATCTNFSVATEIDGIIQPEALKSAVAGAIADHPALRLKVNAGPGNLLYFSSADEKEAIDNVDVKDLGSASVDQILPEEIDTPFKPGSFPMMRCRIMHDAPQDQSTILFTFHHSMTDAPGGVFLVRKIFEHLFSTLSAPAIGTADECAGESILEAQESLYPARYRGWRSFILVLEMMRQVIAALKLRWSRQLPALGRPTAHRRLYVVRFALDEPQTETLKQACRIEKATVHGLLCSSLLFAVRELFDTAAADDGKNLALTVTTAINMRRLLAKTILPENAPGMFATLVNTTHLLTASTSPWDLARDVNRRLAACIDRGAAHLLWWMMPARWFSPDENGALRLRRLMSKGSRGPIVTNLGEIAPPRTAAETPVRSVSFAIGPAEGFPVCLAANSWAGKLFVNCTFDENVIERQQAERLMARTKQRLLAF